MQQASSDKVLVKVVRWAARIWSVLVFLFAILIFMMPDPNAAFPIKVNEMVEIGMYLLASLGLLAAWRWEAWGAAVAVLGVIGHQAAFFAFRGVWMINPLGYVILAPALAYLGVWWAGRRGRQVQGVL